MPPAIPATPSGAADRGSVTKGATMASTARLLIHTMRDVVIVNFQDASILDTQAVEQIGQALYELTDARNHRKLILDFSKVQFLSSSALGVLITLRKKSAAIKGDVVLCAIRKELMKVFEITNLHKMFTIRPNETEALAHFGMTTAG
jgi:anti-sigma B factor antagonist